MVNKDRLRENLKQIVEIMKSNPKVEKVILFGSRAKETAKKQSDIDLAVVCPEMSFREFLRLYSQIEELNIPLMVDMVKFENANPSLKDEIIKHGKIIYHREVEDA